MLPLSRFGNALAAYKAEFDENFDELIMAAEILSRKSNTIERDDNGNFYIQVIGPLDNAIDTLEVMLRKLRKTKDSQ